MWTKIFFIFFPLEIPPPTYVLWRARLFLSSLLQSRQHECKNKIFCWCLPGICLTKALSLREIIRYKKWERLQKLQLFLSWPPDSSLEETENAKEEMMVWTLMNPKRGDPPAHCFVEAENRDSLVTVPMWSPKEMPGLQRINGFMEYPKLH